MSDSYRRHYGIQLLDDLHNYFPALLYDIPSFNTVQDVLEYVRDRTARRFNLFDTAEESYRSSQTIPGGQIAEVRHEQVVNLYRNPPVDLLIVTETPRRLREFNDFIAPQAPQRHQLPHPGPIRHRFPMQSYEDVVVHVSQEVLDEATVKTTLAQDIEENCSVCQDRMKQGESIRILGCDHEFHCVCVDPWLLTRSVLCPTCRHDIRTDIPGARDGELGVPTIGVPTIGVPTISVPTIGVPTIGVPTIGVPRIGLPTRPTLRMRPLYEEETGLDQLIQRLFTLGSSVSNPSA